MSTDDSSGPSMPHELTGPLGQVGDAGGGRVPLLAPNPAPSAIAGGSPGLSTGAATIPLAPTMPSDDPASLALLIGRMANQLFVGSPVSPIPMSPSNAVTAAMAASPHASPGIAPSLVASAPGVPAAETPSDVTATASPLVEPHAATSRDVTALPTPSGTPYGDAPFNGTPSVGAMPNVGVPTGPTTPTTPTPPTLPTPPPLPPPPTPSVPHGAAVPMRPDVASPGTRFDASSFDAPQGLETLSVPLVETSPTTRAMSSQAGHDLAPLAAAPRPPASGSPFGSAPTFGNVAGVWPSELPAASVPTAPTVPGGAVPSSPLGTTSPPTAPPSSPRGGHLVPSPSAPTGGAPASPFAATSLATFGVPPSALGEDFDLPLVSATPIDAAPSFTPDPDALGLDSAAGNVRDGSPAQPAQPALVRDLGGKPFDPYAVRRDFPILEERVHGNKRLVWLDNAATTQKPRAVIDRLSHFYEHENSNIHRAAHTLAARATDAYENARESVRRFLNAPSAGEIIFVRGATEGINLVAKSWGRRNITAGDEIVITHLEHHANIVPWQQLCAETGARLRVAPVDARGDVILEDYERLMCSRTKLVAFTQVSNALGSITPAREMVAIAKRYGAHVLVDGAQAVSHMRVDVQQLDCDFYVFSGHKVFAPTGIGAVFGKRAILEAMPPWQGGGNMIADVTFEKTTYHPPPFRFEAGTGNIADAVGLGAALDYVMRIGMDVIDRYEHELLVYATEHLARVPGLTMIGTARHKAGVLSFVLDGQRTEDVGAALDKDGIAVRSGHHCAQPILRRFGLEASVRASLAFYNIVEDIDALVEALHRLQAGRR